MMPDDVGPFVHMEQEMDLSIKSEEDGIAIVEKMVSGAGGFYLDIEFATGITMKGYFTPQECSIPTPKTDAKKRS